MKVLLTLLALYGGANIVATTAILLDRGVMRPSLRVWTGWLVITLMLIAAAPIHLALFVKNLKERRPDPSTKLGVNNPRRALE